MHIEEFAMKKDTPIYDFFPIGESRLYWYIYKVGPLRMFVFDDKVRSICSYFKVGLQHLVIEIINILVHNNVLWFLQIPVFFPHDRL